MKRKSKRCSTGHGTGVTPPIDLRARLKHGEARISLGALGSVERSEPTRARAKKTAEWRVGYFRKRRAARLALVAENLRNLGTWPFKP